ALDPGMLVGPAAPEGPEVGGPLLRTWLGGGSQVLLTVVVAVLAGVGIGYHRPLAQRSLPVLLGVLSPLLLIGMVPLLTVGMPGRFDGGLSEAFLGSMYPPVVVVPLVFLCAYLADAARA